MDSIQLGSSRPANAAERRFLTVLFCDLAESTAMSARLDPEVMASIIGRYQECCAAAVSRFMGQVSRYVGDGVLAYFGYPTSHGDSAERALRAALEVVRGVASIESDLGLPLKVRIGIETGPVVIGDLPGSNAVERNAVVGETPHLAARLQQRAAHNTVVIGPRTRRLVGKLFDCVELPAEVLKGFDAPVEAWQVVGERVLASRFDVRRAFGLTPYVGRELEIDALDASWRAAQAGAGQLMVIKGEPGIGKSRLLQEFSRRLDKQVRRVDYIGSPFLRNSLLAPVITQIERSAALAPDDTPAAKRAKLDAMLRSDGLAEVQAAAELASLLSLPRAAADAPSEPDPRRRRLKTLSTVITWIEALAQRGPLLVVCEDIHWFDYTTLEMLELLAVRVARLPVLLLATTRPGSPPAWSQRAETTTLTLEKLDRDVAARMARAAAGRMQVLPSELAQRIVERSDGSPLYIEELTRAILESSATSWSAAAAELRIPETLQDLLIARLDNAAPIKEVAQIGAAIGREFPYRLLEAVSLVEQPELSATLDRLVEADLLNRNDGSAGTVYAFKHALVRDAAYETLLFARRREIHASIAAALESHFPETQDTRPELLAEHWERAEAGEKAIHYWTLAGRRAAGRSADYDADSHLRRALELIRQLPAGRARDLVELDVLIQHGGVLRVIKGPPADETGTAFARARDLCRKVRDNTLLVPALSGVYAYHLVRAENAQAAETAQQLLIVAESRRDPQALMIAHRTVGMVLVHTGDLARARDHLECSLALYNNERDQGLAFLYGTDHAQTAAGWLAKALWLLGSPRAAAEREAWAVAHGAKVNHLFSSIQGAMFRTTTRLFARDWIGAASLAQETQALAQRHSLRYALSFTKFCLAACRAIRCADRYAIDEMRAAAEGWGRLNYRPFYLGLIAEAQARAGDHESALQTLDEAQTVVESTDERWVEAELHRVRGELLMLRDRSAATAAEVHFRRAIELARGQSARSWELRASVSLGALLSTLGRSDEARALLRPLQSAFATESDLPDARVALELLEVLGL